MNRAGVFALIVLALAYQTLALPFYRIGDAGPDFVLVVLLYMAFFAPVLELLAVTFPAAVVLDLLSLDPLGTHVLAYVAPVLMVRRAQGWFVVASPALRWIVVLAAALLAAGLRGVAVAVLDGSGAGSPGVAAVSALYTAGVGVPIHALLDRFRPVIGWGRDRKLAGGR